MRELDNLIKKYEDIFLEKLDISNWTYEYCKKLLSEIKLKRNKILNENFYINIVNNKKYFQMLILEDICRIMLTEIKPKRTNKKEKREKKGVLKNAQ